MADYKKETMPTLWLCDGMKECRRSVGCFLNGGDCRHTTSARHALKERGMFDRLIFNSTNEAFWQTGQFGKESV